MIDAQAPLSEEVWNAWRDCLEGDDPNSIFQQIVLLTWDTVIYRFVLECRRNLFEHYPDNLPFNPHYHSFIDRNYYQSQAITIRRLADRSYGLSGKRGVYSLFALINDIKARRQELTRDVFLKLNHLPYDPSERREQERIYIQEQTISGNKAFWIPPEYDGDPIQDAHRKFDRLSGKRSSDRSPNDVTTQQVFDRLLARLDGCKSVTDYVDKFVAHSATPESRSIDGAKNDITLKQVWVAHQILYEVAEFISGVLFSKSMIPLPFEPPDFYDHWEGFSSEVDATSRLEKIFERYREETDKWRVEGAERLWNFIEG